jgi:F420-dependent oxidoreductase-like protein
MKLGIGIDYAVSYSEFPVEKVLLAERLGYDSVWTAENYGSDALTPLAYLAAITKRIRLGTAVCVISARSPAAAAMSFGTIEAMGARGRCVAGFGTSGPQVAEGWYGQPWGTPYWRVRDYVSIVRAIFERAAPVTHAGREISLPYEGPGASGMSKALKTILHIRPDLPIWLGTGGDAMVRLTAEIADGWLPLDFVPGSMARYRPLLEEGFRRAGGGKSFKDFEIQTRVNVRITDDVGEGLKTWKPFIALTVGGMGHPKLNFHNRKMVARGFPEAASRIQELYLAGRKDEAAAAVPDEYLDDMSLVGPVGRIRERYRRWEDSGVTGLTVNTEQPEAMELMAELAGARPAAAV